MSNTDESQQDGTAPDDAVAALEHLTFAQRAAITGELPVPEVNWQQPPGPDSIRAPTGRDVGALLIELSGQLPDLAQDVAANRLTPHEVQLHIDLFTKFAELLARYKLTHWQETVVDGQSGNGADSCATD